MNRLDIKKQTQIIADVGKVCSEYQDRVLRDLPCVKIQCDEIWSYCQSKEKNVPQEKKGTFGIGDVYTWTAICADTKLIPTWYVGKRDRHSANIFMHDLASRLTNRIQLTTDGFSPYIEAVDNAFGSEVDFSQLIKTYKKAGRESDTRYSPAKFNGTKKITITGNPDPKEVSTSYVERQNLTMRMSMRRFTRLTNAFSKKIENLEHAVSLHFMYYNFCRIHQTLRVTPAMEAGVTSRLWEIEDILKLLKSN